MHAIIEQKPVPATPKILNLYFSQVLGPLVSQCVIAHGFSFYNKERAERSNCGVLRFIMLSTKLFYNKDSQVRQTQGDLLTSIASVIAGTRIRKVVFPWLEFQGRKFWAQIFSEYSWFQIVPNFEEGRWKPDWSSLALLHRKAQKKLNLSRLESEKYIKSKVRSKIEALDLPRIPKGNELIWKYSQPCQIYHQLMVHQSDTSLPSESKIPKVSTLRCFYTNTGSLNQKKLDQIRATNGRNAMNVDGASCQDLDILCLSEVRSPEHIKPLSKGYDVIHQLDNERYGAGVACMIKKTIVRDTRLALLDHNSIILVIYPAGSPVLIACCYIEHNHKSARIKTFLQMVVAVASQFDNIPILITGDFNVSKETLSASLEQNWDLSESRCVRIRDPDFDTWANLQKMLNPAPVKEFASWKRRSLFSRIDYVLSNLSVRVRTFEGISDHLSFIVDMPLGKLNPLPKPKLIKRNQIKMDLLSITRNLDLKKTQYSGEPIINILKHFQTHKSTYISELTPMLKSFEDVNFSPAPVSEGEIGDWILNFQDTVKAVSLLRFSNRSGQAFDSIRKITKYNAFLKREGSIVTALKDSEGQIITNTDIVNKKLLDTLRMGESNAKKHHVQHQDSLLSNKEIILPNLKLKEITDILLDLKTGRCMPTPSIPDAWYRDLAKDYRENRELLLHIASLWNTNVLSKVPSVFEMKLVPLNKSHPYIPTAENVRPIFATSSTFKVLEKRFTQGLVDFYNSRGSGAKFQVGFLPGLSTHVNLLRLDQLVGSLISNGKPVKKRTVPLVLFLDFQQAYNSINLDRTFVMMRNDGYPQADVLFLKWLYSQQTAKAGGLEFKPSVGVPQGGINSPILFNITLFYMMKEFKQKIQKWIFADPATSAFKLQLIPDDNNTLGYADDIAIVLWVYEQAFGKESKIGHLRLLDEYLSVLSDVAKGWGLIINWKKSGVLFLGNKRNYRHLITEKPSQNPTLKSQSNLGNAAVGESYSKYQLARKMTNPIPVVEYYRYLGFYVNNKFNAKESFKFLSRKLNFLSFAFYPITQQNPNLKFVQNLWNTLARPLIDYYAILALDMGESVFNELIHISRKSLRAFIGLPNGTPKRIVDFLMGYDPKLWSIESISHWKEQLTQYRKNRLCKSLKSPSSQSSFNFSLLTRTWLQIVNVFYSRIGCKFEECAKKEVKSRSRIDTAHLIHHFPQRKIPEIREKIDESLHLSQLIPSLSKKVRRLNNPKVVRFSPKIRAEKREAMKELRYALLRWDELEKTFQDILELMNICKWDKLRR